MSAQLLAWTQTLLLAVVPFSLVMTALGVLSAVGMGGWTWTLKPLYDVIAHHSATYGALIRTRHGELIAGVQLDELYQGTALATREQFLAWFDAAGLPHPTTIDLPSGASLFLAERT